LLCASTQHVGQRILAFISTFQFNIVNLIYDGLSLWLLEVMVTTNQPDTPPFFKYLNTRFSYNSTNGAAFFCLLRFAGTVLDGIWLLFSI